MMKKVLLAGSALLAGLSIASAAQAADMAPVAAGYDWTGFYVGANAGVAWNNSSIDGDFVSNDVRLLDNSIDGDQTVFTAGGLLGYNYQIDQIVLGIETDINYLGFSDDRKRDFAFDGLDVTTKSSFEADWFGTIRGRLGFAIDNVLIYGTGGAAYGHMNANGKVTATDGVDTAVWKGSADSTNWGWTVGGGAEYGIDNWSLGLEYLYVDLGDGNWNDSDDTFIDTNLKGSADYAFSTVRATVKYRFQ